MTNAPNVSAIHRETVVVIGGSAGIGLETARRARAEGAGVILTGHSSPGGRCFVSQSFFDPSSDH